MSTNLIYLIDFPAKPMTLQFTDATLTINCIILFVLGKTGLTFLVF